MLITFFITAEQVIYKYLRLLIVLNLAPKEKSIINIFYVYLKSLIIKVSLGSSTNRRLVVLIVLTGSPNGDIIFKNKNLFCFCWSYFMLPLNITLKLDVL